MSRLILSCMAVIVVFLSSCVPPTQTPDVQQPAKPASRLRLLLLKSRLVGQSAVDVIYSWLLCAGRRIGDINQLRQSRLDQFNILYLIAGPDWNPRISICRRRRRSRNWSQITPIQPDRPELRWPRNYSVAPTKAVLRRCYRYRMASFYHWHRIHTAGPVLPR